MLTSCFIYYGSNIYFVTDHMLWNCEIFSNLDVLKQNLLFWIWSKGFVYRQWFIVANKMKQNALILTVFMLIDDMHLKS